MSTVLITGCRGQLGTDCMAVMPSAIGMDVPEIDISNRDLCLQKLTQVMPSVIINCSAYTAVDACESDPVCWDVNADGPKYLAEWAEDNRAFLVHISTDYVFPGTKPLFDAYAETDPVGPVSEYGRSKLAGERSVLDSGVSAAVLRTAWLYGVTGKNFLKTMLRLTVQDPEKEVKVVNDQYGSPTWSYTLAKQIACVVEQRAEGLFHATSEGYCSWHDLACAFLDQMEVGHHFVPCSTDKYPTPAKRPANSILENAALNESGLNLFSDWETELKSFVHQNRETLLNEINLTV